MIPIGEKSRKEVVTREDNTSADRQKPTDAVDYVTGNDYHRRHDEYKHDWMSTRTRQHAMASKALCVMLPTRIDCSLMHCKRSLTI